MLEWRIADGLHHLGLAVGVTYGYYDPTGRERLQGGMMYCCYNYIVDITIEINNLDFSMAS